MFNSDMSSLCRGVILNDRFSYTMKEYENVEGDMFDE